MQKNEVVARVHRWLSYFYGFLLVCTLIFLILGRNIVHSSDMIPGMIFFSIFIGIHYLTSVGAEKKAPWARGLSILLAILLLFGFPIGTVLGIILLSNNNWKEESYN